MKDEKFLLVFTSSVAELTCAGVSVRRAVYAILSAKNIPEIVKRASNEIFSKLEEGKSFSSAITECVAITFPDYYRAFVLIAEETGNIAQTMKWLEKTILVKRKIKEQASVAVAYPILIIFLTAFCGFGVAMFLPRLIPSLSAENSETLRADVLKSCIEGATFLVFVATLIIFAIRKIMNQSPELRLMTSLSFLTESSVPLESALSCAVSSSPVDMPLNRAIIEIKKSLSGGEEPSSAFYKNLSDEGFVLAAKIVSMYLSLSEAGGFSSAFSKTAKFLSDREEKRRNIFLSMMQPLMISVAAVFVMIVLKNLIVPMMFGFSGGSL